MIKVNLSLMFHILKKIANKDKDEKRKNVKMEYKQKNLNLTVFQINSKTTLSGGKN